MHKVEYAIQKAILHQVPDQLEQLQNTPVAPLQEPDFTVRQTMPPKKRVPFGKGFLILCILLVVLFTCASLLLTHRTTAAVLTIDGPCGIELTLNKAGTILQTEATNEAGAAFLDDWTAPSAKAKEAIPSLLEEMVSSGVFSNTTEPVLLSLVTQENVDFDLEDDLLFDVASALWAKEQLPSLLLCQETDVDVLRKAMKAWRPEGVSFGKWILAGELAEESEEIDQGTWASMTLSDLVLTAASQGLDLDDLLDLKEESFLLWLDTIQNASDSSLEETSIDAVTLPSPLPSSKEEAFGHQNQYHGNHFDDDEEEDDEDDDD